MHMKCMYKLVKCIKQKGKLFGGNMDLEKWDRLGILVWIWGYWYGSGDIGMDLGILVWIWGKE